MDKIRTRLPVVRQEVGDTWIQGIASDPFKMANYRAISGAIQDCVRAGIGKITLNKLVGSYGRLRGDN